MPSSHRSPRPAAASSCTSSSRAALLADPGPPEGVRLEDCEGVSRGGFGAPRRGGARRHGGTRSRSARPVSTGSSTGPGTIERSSAGACGALSSDPEVAPAHRDRPSRGFPRPPTAARSTDRVGRPARPDRCRLRRDISSRGSRSNCRDAEDNEMVQQSTDDRTSTLTKCCARSRARRTSTSSAGSARSKTRWPRPPRSSIGSRSRCAPTSTASTGHVRGLHLSRRWSSWSTTRPPSGSVEEAQPASRTPWSATRSCSRSPPRGSAASPRSRPSRCSTSACARPSARRSTTSTSTASARWSTAP